MLLICKIYVNDRYSPSKEELSRSSIKDIVMYLHNSHDFYVGIALDTLEKFIKRWQARWTKSTAESS